MSVCVYECMCVSVCVVVCVREIESVSAFVCVFVGVCEAREYVFETIYLFVYLPHHHLVFSYFFLFIFSSFSLLHDRVKVRDL